MSSFSGLNIGLSSLYASRRALELTGQNISNVNTEGYSRQRADLQSVGGPVKPALHSKYDGAGNGVMVAGVDRLRDLFLEARALTERGTAAGLAGDRVLLGRVEAVLSEPGDAGIQTQLADFWDGWDDVANKPDSLAARSQVIERAQTLAAGINGAVDKLDAQYDASHQQLAATVLDINAVAVGCRRLQPGDRVTRRSPGCRPNDLLDKRDVLVQRLGELAGVTVKQGEFGSVDVMLGDTALVAGHDQPRCCEVAGRRWHAARQRGRSAVVWGDPADPADVGPPALVGGAAGSLRQGPERRAAPLPRPARRRRRQGPRAGQRRARRRGVRPERRSPVRPSSLSTRRPARRRPSPTRRRSRRAAARRRRSGDRGGAKAAQLAELATAKGGADELYRRTVVALGVEAQAAGRRVEIQDNILGQIDAARESESGVNLDEEMTNMLAFQKAYEGAARFMSAIDQMLDTLINRTGVVGR